MAWKKNRKLAAKGLRDLQYLPKQRCGWDCTLASLAYGVRRVILGASPDLGAWAVRHGLPASARYQDMGPDARVLWHGTSRVRAEKIAEHGLFHKRGLWTTLDPSIAHGFCRSRSDRFGAEGAVVCLVLDRGELDRGRDFDVEGKGDIFRFHHGLPPDLVEYVLVNDEIRFMGHRRARRPAPWRAAAFKKRSGEWVPVQKAPVRYSEAASYSSVRDFAQICIERLMAELGEVTALEVFSTLYASISPWDALAHEGIFGLIEEKCVPHRRTSKCQTFRARGDSEVLRRGG